MKRAEREVVLPPALTTTTFVQKGHVMAKANRTVPALSRQQVELFWSHIDRSESDKCWPWLKFLDKMGYGQCSINGTCFYSHRVSFTLVNGPIPDGLCVLHKCDNPKCNNPGHLFLGTRTDNSKDKMAKGRHRCGRKLNVEKVLKIRESYSRGGVTQDGLAAEHGVCQAVIWKIVRRKSWIHV